MIRIALIGRPNVGKSTLFNRMVGQKLAIVHNQPGITRDLREARAKILGHKVMVVDTAGLEDHKDGSLPARMRELTLIGIQEADICLFMVDVRAGITALDHELALMLRRTNKPVFLLLNKSEGHKAQEGALDSYALALGEPLAISAEHGIGIEDLYQALLPELDCLEEKNAAKKDDILDTSETEQTTDAEDLDAEDPLPEQARDPDVPIQLAIVGRPNVGKSSLVNKLLGVDRLLTGPEAGITRDAISFQIDWRGQKFKIFDTAGIRKRNKVTDQVEGLSVGDSLRAIRFAEVVVLLLDPSEAFEQQDLRIADLIAREGRAVVIGINKWDLVKNRAAKEAEFEETLDRLLPQIRGVSLVFLSAQTKENISRLHTAVLEAYDIWNKRVSTGKLNRWLADEIAHHPPPAPAGRRIKMRYITQVKARPPQFVIKSSRADEIPEHYTRYLINGLRKSFGFWGVPIRLIFRANENPYDKGRK